MRLENCQSCPHLSGADCMHHKKPIARIKGCSMCPGGRIFFRSRSGKEAFRLNVLNKKGKDTK